MNIKYKKQYTAPEMTVVSFRTERGYARSQFLGAELFSGSGNNVENHTVHSGWGDDNNNTFF